MTDIETIQGHLDSALRHLEHRRQACVIAEIRRAQEALSALDRLTPKQSGDGYWQKRYETPEDTIEVQIDSKGEVRALSFKKGWISCRETDSGCEARDVGDGTRPASPADGEAWKTLSDDRVKTMMINFGYPNSQSLYHLIMQVQNEIWHLNGCPGWSAQPAPEPKEDALDEALGACDTIQYILAKFMSAEKECLIENVEFIRQHLRGEK